MKLTFIYGCFLHLGSLIGSIAASAEASSHPITKVIKMLEGLQQKAIIEGKTEEVAYSKFVYWCKSSIDNLNDAIDEETEKIAELEDLLAGKNKEKEGLEEEITDLTEQIKDLDASAVKAKKERKDEADLYAKALSDLKSTIAAVSSALKSMTSAKKTTDPALLSVQQNVRKVLSFIDVDSSLTDEQFSVLQDFGGATTTRPAQLAKGDAAKHVDKYEFKSGSVVELLKQLERKFIDDKVALTTAETNAQNAYALEKSARDNAIKMAKASKDKKNTILAKVKAKIASAQSDLKNEKSDKAADTKAKLDTEEQCLTKKNEWEERSKTRAQEIEAMEQAQKILAEATGVRTTAAKNPVLPTSPVLLQVSSDNKPKLAAVAVLREAAKATHSHALERIAMEVSAHLNAPFDQVNGMLEKMIFRLMDEQKQEDEHKLWCDQELKKTNVMKDDKEDKLKDLKAEIKSETAAVVKLTDEIKAAQDMISKITSFMKEATEIREAGKQENKDVIADAEQAQKALENAIAVLTTFYKESGEIKKEPWEFIQADAPVKLPKNPATWSSSYTGVTDPDKQPSGIIVVLKTVMSDFAKVEAQSKSQEAIDEKEYKKAMKDNQIEKARRAKESEMKSNEKASRSEKIALLESQKKDTSNELDKTNQYLKDLQPACVTGDSTYDDRKKARTMEIKALQKAQNILADAFKGLSPSFLQIRRNI